MIRPHTPSPLPGRSNKDRLEIDPVRIDSTVNIQIWFHPVAVHIAGMRFLGAETAVNIDLLDARAPKRSHCGAQPFQKPAPTRRKTEAFFYLLQRRLMITGRQGAGLRIERRNQAAFIISNTNPIVNDLADYQGRQHIVNHYQASPRSLRTLETT